MSRQRYEILLKFFHFNDNSQCPSNSSPDYDRLYKIRPLLDYLSEKCLTVYTPSENVSVDESLVKFKGRLHFKQFLPSKRARYGIKLYKLCESTTGYTSAFRVYQGRDSELNPQGCPAGLGANGKVVWELMGPLLQKGYKLFIDNYYTSIPLFQSLQEANTGACGTFRRNRRGFPQSLLAKKLQRGQSDALRSGNLLALRYKDRKDVLMLSTIHTEATVPVRERGSTTDKQKPTCILEYNKYMGGTDLSDQVLKPYEVMRKSYVWYKKLSIYLLQMAMYNSYVLYKKSGGTQTFLCYQEIVIEKLMYPIRGPTLPLEVEEIRRLVERHFIAAIPPTQNQTHPQRRCRVCSKRGIRRDTRYFCPDCPSRPALCIGNCFKVYHTRARF
ncbi:piggyBac transposable element-derived protein 4-like [Bufo gargarizans]|uniref:piggyBac transposable element-derived protein 4-like n=1 Tax=Bufo gargarizans TaxID=30331 RepID=UPI001CF30288|nr:piggyBac transposable element-derived protein 4-like [Bufo gargarizans]